MNYTFTKIFFAFVFAAMLLHTAGASSTAPIVTFNAVMPYGSTNAIWVVPSPSSDGSNVVIDGFTYNSAMSGSTFYDAYQLSPGQHSVTGCDTTSSTCNGPITLYVNQQGATIIVDNPVILPGTYDHFENTPFWGFSTSYTVWWSNTPNSCLPSVGPCPQNGANCELFNSQYPIQGSCSIFGINPQCAFNGVTNPQNEVPGNTYALCMSMDGGAGFIANTYTVSTTAIGSSPLSINSDSGLIIAKGASFTTNLISADSQDNYPTMFFEFANGGYDNGYSCVDPTTLSQSGYSTCDSPNSITTTQCLLTAPTTSGTQATPNIQLSTTNLGPGTYMLCGYELGTNPVDGGPYPTLSTASAFTVKCLTNPCVNNGQSPPVATNAIDYWSCAGYGDATIFMLVLGLVVFVLGGALFAGSTLLPGQTKGVAQGYAIGLIIAGVASFALAVIAIWVFTAVSGVSIGSILTGTQCTPTFT